MKVTLRIPKEAFAKMTLLNEKVPAHFKNARYWTGRKFVYWELSSLPLAVAKATVFQTKAQVDHIPGAGVFEGAIDQEQ